MALSALSQHASVTVSDLASTGSPVPLTVLMRDDMDEVSDFFPFDDLATLSPQSKKATDSVSFRSLISSGIAGSQEVSLIRSGCRLENGDVDCPRACDDTSVFFGSLETFYNCAALASISYWTAESKRYFISSEAERNASELMGDSSLEDFDARSTLNNFVSCAREACTEDGLSMPCNESVRNLSRDDSSDEQIFEAMAEFCPSIEAEIDPDIFGPGVLISYVLQVSFATMLYMAVKGFTIWVRLSEKPQRQPRALTRVGTMLWPDTSAMSRTSVGLATTLVEFQEAQCWFIFAVQIASILAIANNSQEGAFWGEIIVNAALAFHVSQNGILPMFLIQICLHNEGIRNTHTFVGFFIEYILAIIAATQKVHFKNVFSMFRNQSELSACGGNPSPRTYCAAIESVDGLQLNFFPHPMLYKVAFLALDTIAILALIADQVAWFLRKHRRTKHITIGRHRIGRFPDNEFKGHWVKSKRWFWRILEFVYVVINILYMVSLARVIKGESFESGRWSYGQIMAMTAWGPVIVKLFDLILSGPQMNGIGMNTGPPRLRIDNVLNLRTGASMDIDEDDRKRIPRGPPIDDPPTPRRPEDVDPESRPEKSDSGMLSEPKDFAAPSEGIDRKE